MQGTCPVCDAPITIPANTEVSEILTCGECQTRVVVQEITKTTVTLGQAPAVEEDWGE